MFWILDESCLSGLQNQSFPTFLEFVLLLTNHMKRLFLFLSLLLPFVVIKANPVKPLASKIQSLKEKGGNFPEYTIFSRSQTGDKQSIPSALHKGEFLYQNPEILSRLFKQHPEAIRISIPYLSGSLAISLFRTELFTPDAIIHTDKGEAVTFSPGWHYRGIIDGDPTSLVAFSVYENEVTAILSSTKLQNVTVSRMPFSKDPNQYLIFSDADLKAKKSLSCQLKDPADPISLYSTEPFVPGTYTTTDKCLRIYYEINFDVYQRNDSSLTNTLNWISTLHNAVAAIFQNDGITMAISGIFVWTTPTPFETLETFSKYRSSFHGDLAGFITGRGGGGFAGSIGAFCFNYNSNYGGSGQYQISDTEFFLDSIPQFPNSVFVVSHEFGHLCGSEHTHSCVWNGNNTQIDDCGNITPLPWENNYCYDSIHPKIPLPGEATIMSYCGNALAAGFGPQPSERMRVKMNGATCLGTNCLISCVPTLDSVHIINAGFNSVKFQVFDSDTSVHEWLMRLTQYGMQTGEWLSLTNNPHTITGTLPSVNDYEIQVKSICDAPFSANYVTARVFSTPYSFCGTLFKDDGGDDMYLGLNRRYTFYPDDSSRRVSAAFSFLDLHPTDTLFAYDGPSVSSPLLGTYIGFGLPLPTLVSSDPTGALTFDFRTDNNFNTTWFGWNANITCVLPTNLENVIPEIPVQFYPNPTSGKGILVFPENMIGSAFYIFNSLGMNIRSGIATDKEMRLDLHTFPDGIYWIQSAKTGTPLRISVQK